MTNYQVIALGGNLTRDVEVKGKELNLAKFSVAVSSGFGDKKKTAFVDCISFKTKSEKSWEILTGLKKGTNVGVRGTLSTESWEKDGVKRSALVLTVREFDVYSPREEAAAASAEADTKPAKASKPAPASSEDEADDLPF
jgi:single-strand DNA-binding protein